MNAKLVTDQEVAIKVLSPQELETWNKLHSYVYFAELGSICLDGYYTEEQLRVILKVYSFWKDYS